MTYDGSFWWLNTKQWKSLKFWKWSILFLIFLHSLHSPMRYGDRCSKNCLPVSDYHCIWYPCCSFGSSFFCSKKLIDKLEHSLRNSDFLTISNGDRIEIIHITYPTWLARTTRWGEEEFHKINIAYQLRHQKPNFWKCLPFENIGGESFRCRGFNPFFWGQD